MQHYMKTKPNKTVLKPSAWCVCVLVYAGAWYACVFASLMWLCSYMILCLRACKPKVLVSLCTLRGCVLACLPYLLCLNVLRVYMLAWFAHLSYLPYLSIIKSKKSKIKIFVCIVTMNIFFACNSFVFIDTKLKHYILKSI